MHLFDTRQGEVFLHQRQSNYAHPSPGAAAALKIVVLAATDRGQSRENNEDNFIVFDLRRRMSQPAGLEVVSLVASPGMLLAVADGMGGHQAGQVASRMCGENLPRELLKLLTTGTEISVDAKSALVQVIEATSGLIYKAAERNPDYSGMGTTLTAALLTGPQVHLAHVGDSRAYLLRRGALRQLTRDQTVADSLRRDAPGVQVESRYESILVQAVGAVPSLQVEATTADLKPGDRLLLCTDGLHRVLSDSRIAQILRDRDTLTAKASRLIAGANQAGGPDNVTLVLCEASRSARK